MTSVTENSRRAGYVAGLRALADLLDTTPDLPLPAERRFTWSVLSSTDPVAEVARLAHLLPGRLDKNAPTGAYGSKYYTLTGRLHGLTTEIAAFREQVCERVVTGTHEETEIVPAPDAPVVTVTRTVEDYEWVCKSVLAEATR